MPTYRFVALALAAAGWSVWGALCCCCCCCCFCCCCCWSLWRAFLAQSFLDQSLTTQSRPRQSFGQKGRPSLPLPFFRFPFWSWFT